MQQMMQMQQQQQQQQQQQYYDPTAVPEPHHPASAGMGMGMGTGGAGDEYAFNPHHKVIFSSPPNIMFSLPPDSRLFVGNLASEKTSREELARIFAQYGDIFEVVLKESYGFVQYDNPQSCLEAIRMENGRVVAGLKMGMCFE
jgi:hypothetical protein